LKRSNSHPWNCSALIGENKQTKQSRHFWKLLAFLGLWMMERVSSHEQKPIHVPLIFTCLAESREWGKMHVGGSERFNAELWSISREKNLWRLISHIKINNENPM
jgi:hypothetical protein